MIDSDVSGPGAVDLDPASQQPGLLVVLLLVVVLSVVVAAAMMSPWAFVTWFPAAPPKSAAVVIAETLAAQGMEFDAEAFQRGKAKFASSCIACHTADGGAREGLGKDVVHSEFTASRSDKELLTFLKLGRNPGDPLNTTGVGMPPKGGDPTLMDDDLRDLIVYIRGLQVTAGVAFTQ